MTTIVDFQVDLDQLELADGSTFTALSTADVESDAEGTYFKLTGLLVEGRRVETTSWRFAAVAEWIDLNTRETLGIVRSAHAAATSPEARAESRACHFDHQRRAA